MIGIEVIIAQELEDGVEGRKEASDSLNSHNTESSSLDLEMKTGSPSQNCRKQV
jgi:hypothetical protein